MKRSDILHSAEKCVCGDREEDYGSPEDNFSAIADLWTAYMDCDFSALDVAIMLALLKIGRIASGRVKDDNFIDLAGYAACAGEIALGDGGEDLLNMTPKTIAEEAFKRFEEECAKRMEDSCKPGGRE